jgi:hypothetical protein
MSKLNKIDTPAKIGRPTLYTKKLADDICLKIATTSTSVRQLCERNPHWPNRDTIYQWRIKHKDFADQYAQAKCQQAELLIDEIIEIADERSFDTTENNDGHLIPDHEYMQRSRLRIDTRKWIACKLIPKVYGDKIQNEHSGGITLRHEDALKELE